MSIIKTINFFVFIWFYYMLRVISFLFCSIIIDSHFTSLNFSHSIIKSDEIEMKMNVTKRLSFELTSNCKFLVNCSSFLIETERNKITWSSINAERDTDNKSDDGCIPFEYTVFIYSILLCVCQQSVHFQWISSTQNMVSIECPRTSSISLKCYLLFIYSIE